MVPVSVDSIMLNTLPIPMPSMITLRPIKPISPLSETQQKHNAQSEENFNTDDDTIDFQSTAIDDKAEQNFSFDSSRILPIYIGSTEAGAIAAAIHNNKSQRPLTHTLMDNMLTSMGGKVARVTIDRVEGSIFYASIYIKTDSGKLISVDARPSDAIALAIRSRCVILVDDNVFDTAAFPADISPEDEKKIQLEEFHNFVETISPDDFLEDKTGNNAQK